MFVDISQEYLVHAASPYLQKNAKKKKKDYFAV